MHCIKSLAEYKEKFVDANTRFWLVVHLPLFSSPPGDENLDLNVCFNVYLLLQNVDILLLDYAVT
jgi:hypothetical protein